MNQSDRWKCDMPDLTKSKESFNITNLPYYDVSVCSLKAAWSIAESIKGGKLDKMEKVKVASLFMECDEDFDELEKRLTECTQKLESTNNN